MIIKRKKEKLTVKKDTLKIRKNSKERKKPLKN